MEVFKMSEKYYNLNRINKKNAQYNIIIGERSNGKTYICFKHGLELCFKSGYKDKFAYLRRWQDDIKGQRASNIFSAINANGEVTKITNGEYDSIEYYAGKCYFGTYNEMLNKVVRGELCCYLFALTSMEHDKSASYPDIKTIIFDEFLTRRMYLPDEFVNFMNVLSTIIRNRKDVKIYMLGNTVNKFCPYFKEMGLEHIKEQKQGTIDLYKYGDSDLQVACEYCSTINKNKESNIYFAFNNPKLQMITGGKWEMDAYPHLPYRYKNSDIEFIFFIDFDDKILQCEVINTGESMFIYIHDKTTPIKNDDDLIYSLKISDKPNVINGFGKGGKITTKIYSFFVNNKVFYQDNSIGEIVRNFMIQTGKTLNYS